MFRWGTWLPTMASVEPASGDSASGDMASGDTASGGMASGDTASGDMASGDMASGDMASGDMASGDMASGDMASGDMASGDMAPVETGSFSLEPPVTPSSVVELAALAPPAYVIIAAEKGAVSLTIDGGDLIAAIPLPFVIRIAVGMHGQEDLPVSALAPVHGSAADGRYVIHLARPSRFTHVPGESLRHVEVTRVLGTRFAVHWEESHLFDAWLQGPYVPSLHSMEPVALITENVSLAGLAALDDVSGQALRGASAAVFGWAAFNMEASLLAAAVVAVRLSPLCGALTRGSHRGGTGYPPLRPLVGAVLGDRGFWSNLTEEGRGWVAKIDLEPSDGSSATGPRLWERLSSREGRWFGLGPIERFDDPLYARHTFTSELGYVVPPAGAPPRVRTLAEAHETEECLFIEYEHLS